MPHQCTHCSKIYPDASEEILKGCSCGSKFFYYVRQEKVDSLKDIEEQMIELPKEEKVQIEKDIREMTGMEDELETPVILDLESVKIVGEGKFEIDVVNLFKKDRPLIYNLEEGKYIIDIAASLKQKSDELNDKLKNPDFLGGEDLDSGGEEETEKGEGEDEKIDEERGEDEK